MKTTELMIGDFVIVKDYGIREIIGIRDFDGVVEISENEDSEIEIPYDNISPIPLTPELLEKNGFKDAPRKDTDAHNLAGKWWHKSGDVYVKRYCLNHGTYVYTVGFHPYTRIENLHYVHQLQHALRLCGLDILADNFKIYG